MRQEENFASLADASTSQESFGTPPLTPLLAPLRSPSEKQFPISSPSEKQFPISITNGVPTK